MSAGSWNSSDLPLPVGMTAITFSPREHGGQDFLLPGPEVGEAEHPMQRLAGAADVGAHGRKTGVHCTSSMASAPQASMATRSKPSAAPLLSGR